MSVSCIYGNIDIIKAFIKNSIGNMLFRVPLQLIIV